MAKSVRISEDLYDMAATEAALMHRSLAQQIEHWAALGQAVEARAEGDELRSAIIEHMRSRDHERVRRGKVTTDDLSLLSKARIKKAKLIFAPDAFAEYDDDR